MLLIKNGTIIDPKSKKTYVADILTKDDRILKIEPDIEKTEFFQNMPGKHMLQTIDATDLIVAPGLVDVHVHFRDPGFTAKEDIYSGAKAAAKGGFTSVVMMGNTKPAIDSKETISYVLGKGEETAIHVYTCGTVTMGMEGMELTPMEELYAGGAIGFTDDGKPILDKALTRKAMEAVKKLDVPISFHEEDPQYISENGVNAGPVAKELGLKGSDRQAEISMIERDIELALETGAKINIQHISSKEGVELVRRGKARGSNIHAEATPHHFSLTQEAVLRYGTLAKMNPPLREEEDRIAIIKGLQDGTIDLIATDHAPHTKEEKEKPFAEAPSGILGLETALGLGIEELVHKGYLTMMELMEKMSYNPAQLYKIDAGYIEEGGPADFCIFDELLSHTTYRFVSKAQNSPFGFRPIASEIQYTIAGGKVAYIKMMNYDPAEQDV